MNRDDTHLAILTIEDEDVVREAIADYLEDHGYAVLQARTGEEGLAIFREHAPDVVLTDLKMPGMSGMEVLYRIGEESSETPVIIVSGTGQITDAIEALRTGAWDYMLKPIQDMVMLEFSIHKACEKAQLIRENRRYREHLEEEIQKRTGEIAIRSKELERLLARLESTYRSTIKTITTICDMRDPYTGGHQQRVAELAAAIAVEMGMQEEQVDAIHTAGMLHDVGKIAVPIETLCKPGSLDEVEMMFLRTHPDAGYRILKDIDFSYSIPEIVLQHHERLDGSGYPAGLKGDDIMIEACIISVADVVEAMASHRPYREKLGLACALGEIEKQRGIIYHPDVVGACIALFETNRFGFKNGYDESGNAERRSGKDRRHNADRRYGG